VSRPAASRDLGRELGFGHRWPHPAGGQLHVVGVPGFGEAESPQTPGVLLSQRQQPRYGEFLKGSGQVAQPQATVAEVVIS
jgi:hypothetical protein